MTRASGLGQDALAPSVGPPRAIKAEQGGAFRAIENYQGVSLGVGDDSREVGGIPWTGGTHCAGGVRALDSKTHLAD